MSKKAKKEEQKKQRAPEKTGVLRERAMLVRFSISRWYGTGADEGVTQGIKTEHDASGDIGTFTKRFMSRERLAVINAITNESRRYHKAVTLSWGDSGSRMLPADLFFDYKKEMTGYEMRFNAAVEEFLANFPSFVEKERKRLNGLFKESDYPSIERLRSRFKYVLAIEPLPSAEDFRVDLGEEELRRIRAEIETRIDGQMKEATTDLWDRIGALVDKVKERLADSDAQVRAPLFDHLKELVAVLPRLNVTGDEALKAMGERLSKDLLGVDIEEVKDDPRVRTAVASKADAILNAMKLNRSK